MCCSISTKPVETIPTGITYKGEVLESFSIGLESPWDDIYKLSEWTDDNFGYMKV